MIQRLFAFLILLLVMLPTQTTATEQRATPNCADHADFALPAGAPLSPTYCAVRQRFFEQFFFDGTIAEGINGTHVKFADQTVYMGFALAMFAGEAHILHTANLDTRASELAIERILVEYGRLDVEAELEAYGSTQAGFFVRDWVKPGVRPDLSKLGFTPTVESDYSASDPRNKEMSKDQAAHLLMGMWAVSQWSPDVHFANRTAAQYHTQRLIDFLKAERFYITLPDSDTLVKRGGEALPDAGFLLEMATATLGQDQSSGAEVRYPVGGGGFIIESVSNTHPVIVDEINDNQSLQNIEFSFGPFGSYTYEYDTSSFGYNLALQEFAFESEVDLAAFNAIAEECSDPALGGYGHVWAKLLRALVLGVAVDDRVIEQANSWYDLAPANGPVSDTTDNPIWFKDSRWIRCGDTNSDGAGWVYNGLDFLSLDVLLHLQGQNSADAVHVAPTANTVEIGSPFNPYDSVAEGVTGVVRSGKGVLSIAGGSYGETLVIDRPMRIESADHTLVTIGE